MDLLELLWLLLPVLTTCTPAEQLQDVQVNLGEDVVLTCSIKDGNIYWYMQVEGQVPVAVLRTFNTNTSDSSYYNNISYFKTKYAGMTGNRFLIKNLTEDNRRFYFCGKRESEIIVFKYRFNLVCGSSNQSEPHQEPMRPFWKSDTILFSSLALNALLILAVIGLIFLVCRQMRIRGRRRGNDPLPLTLEALESQNGPQYEEIRLPAPPPPPPPPAAAECVYYKAQLPRASTHQHCSLG